MADYEYQGLGYRVDLEDRQELLAGSQPRETIAYGSIDIKALGVPLGLEEIIRTEDQLQKNSCAGNAATTVEEACVWMQSGGQSVVQLSRDFAYVNGQRYAGISGDNGCTLSGVIKGCQQDGCPLEQYAPYKEYYNTKFTAEAWERAKDYKLAAYSPVQEASDIYEAIAQRMGAGYFGMAWCGQFRDPLPGGFVDEFYEQRGVGFHAVCFLDWSENRDREGYPRLKLFNSHSKRYGRNGISEWSYKAVMQAVNAPNTSAFILSDMEFIKPRFDYHKAKWTLA